jgi:hypothetical protein
MGGRKKSQNKISKQSDLENSSKVHINSDKENIIEMSFDKKKYRAEVPASYENIEIDVSGFIKVRNENIYDHYDFEKKVGEGSFGNVYRGV